MENSWFLSGELWGLSGGEWKLHPHDEGRGGGTSWGVLPLGLAASPPPIYSGALTPSLGCSLTCPLVGISLPCFSTSRTRCLGEALPNFLLHHHHYVVVLLEVPEDPLLPLPTGARGGGRRRTVRVTDYGGAARSWHQDIKPPSSSRPWGRARTLYTIHVCLRERFSRYRSTRVSSRKTVAIYLLDSILFLLQP